MSNSRRGRLRRVRQETKNINHIRILNKFPLPTDTSLRSGRPVSKGNEPKNNQRALSKKLIITTMTKIPTTLLQLVVLCPHARFYSRDGCLQAAQQATPSPVAVMVLAGALSQTFSTLPSVNPGILKYANHHTTVFALCPRTPPWSLSAQAASVLNPRSLEPIAGRDSASSK